MTGSGETTVRGRDGGARDKSCDGNACHIDEATAGEVGNRVSSTSCLPVPALRALTPIFTAIVFLVFLCISLLFPSNLPVFL